MVNLIKEKTRPLIIVLVGLMLVLPVSFLAIKTWASGEKVARPTTIEQLEAAAKTTPSFGNYIDLSAAYINNRQPEKSLEPLAKAHLLRPKNAVVYNNFGVAYILLKRYDEGIAACRKAINLDPTFQLAKNNLNWGLTEKQALQPKQAR